MPHGINTVGHAGKECHINAVMLTYIEFTVTGSGRAEFGEHFPWKTDKNNILNFQGLLGNKG